MWVLWFCHCLWKGNFLSLFIQIWIKWHVYSDFFIEFDFNSSAYEKGVKILTLKQVFATLSITLAQAKASNASENSRNKIRQIIYSLYQTKEITKKLYNKMMNSIKL